MTNTSIYEYVFLIRDLNRNGGQEIQTINIVNGLNAIGIKAAVLTLVPYKGNCKNVFTISDAACSQCSKLASSKINKLSIDFILDKYIKKIILHKLKFLGCKVLINQDYEFSHVLPFHNGIKILQVLHWSIRGYEASLTKTTNYKGFAVFLLNIKLKIRAKLRLKGLKKSDGIIVLTQSAISEIKDLIPNYNESNIHVAYNPLPYIQDATYHTTLENKNICFVGRLSIEKGCIRLLKIWNKISQLLPEYKLSIYGEGPYKKEMLEYIKNYNLQHINLCGYENDLKKIYSNQDLLLSTSDSEGFGLVFIEAFYYGVPVISFDCPVSPKEIIDDAGILIPCYNEDKYANEVIALLKDRERMSQLQDKAIKRARLFYLDNISNKWMEILLKYNKSK